MRTQKFYGRLTAALLLAGTTVLLAGCGNSDLSRTFGFTRDSPDEFSVTKQAPLSMPPDFALRPPRPGESRPQDLSETRQAQEALVPQAALGTPQASLSPGQQALVQEAGPPAPRGIRQDLRQDSEKREAANDSFVNKLLFWRQPAPGSAVVDPKREAQRLRQNSALGESPETGHTPIIQPHQKSWLDSLF
ncbi:MAG TPA: DUF3035 domain-containing protein [Acetobacteraceae bacterium]|nr:DUF3035 domain-containing protein [Acetobacteraceae bacterium]